MTRHYAVAVGLTIPVSPYAGLNATFWPSVEEVEEMVLPLWAEKKEAYAKLVNAVREARRVLADAGLHKQAEAIAFPEWEEPAWRVEPRPATGAYTIDPFVGWWVRHGICRA